MTEVLTANRLTDGRVVWRTADGWSEQFSDAAKFEPDAAQAALAEAKAQPTVYVGPYLALLSDDGAVRLRERLKESIRAGGPTVETVGA